MLRGWNMARVRTPTLPHPHFPTPTRTSDMEQVLMEERGKVDAQLEAERLQQRVAELEDNAAQLRAQLQRAQDGLADGPKSANREAGDLPSDVQARGSSSSEVEAPGGNNGSTEADAEMAR